jgi:hypothetical protein
MPQEQLASPERVSLLEVTTNLFNAVEASPKATPKLVTKEAEGTFTNTGLDTEHYSIECTKLEDGENNTQVISVENREVGQEIWDRYKGATTYKVEAIILENKVLLREVVGGLVDGRPHTEKITADTDEERLPLYDFIMAASQEVQGQ